MKKIKLNKAVILGCISLLSVILITSAVMIKQEEPWTIHQLMKPEELAKVLNDSDKTNDPIILNIGPSGSIKGAIDIGAVNNDKGLNLLNDKIKKLPKNKEVVIYCGCCPFKDCPNIRPAFSLLTNEGFTNHKLLNLPSNLKVDWIDKKFPTKD
jgi:thiosulfate/3-mercaptopyruvate sulfurtransferase